MNLNPYAPPASGSADALRTDAAVSDRIVEAMRRAKPWVSLVAISGFVFGGFSVLIGLVMLFAAPKAEFMEGLGVVYLVWSGITLGGSLLLHRYGRRIRRLLYGGGMAELELALEAQTRFWQLAGVITLISILLMVSGFVMMVLFARQMSGFF